MPNIVKEYQFTNLSSDHLYQICLSIFGEMGITEIKESIESGDQEVRTITGVAPSMWGWGGMKLSLKVYQEENRSLMELDGYIAQLGVSPLTKKMDEFLNKLQEKLLQKYNYNFQFEKLTRFLPKYKLNFSKVDAVVFIAITVVTFITTAAEVFGGLSSALLIVPTLAVGYYLGKKVLFNKPKENN